MNDTIWTILIILVVVFLIVVPYKIAKKQILTCSKCRSKNIRRTTGKRPLERKKRALIAAAVPYYEYEYECTSCGHRFWSTIESMIEAA